jgi:16S rRNA (guanine527-N7)-methyltransferase
MVSRETSPPDLPGWIVAALPGLTRYAELLTGPGTQRGLIGPREGERIWDRHILNCAVVADPELGFVPSGASVADVGSGAGLPGLVWALVRPDISVVLIESLLRRATFLTECVHELQLGDQVQVLRARAEDASGRGSGVQVATSRAVAPLGKLARWSAPLLNDGGSLVAIKGESATEEVTRDAADIAAMDLVDLAVHEVPGLGDAPSTYVVTARKAAAQ